MSKNAVVLMLAVLFMAMVLVVVNQFLYSDSDQQPVPIPGVNQGQNSAFNNLDNLPLGGNNSQAPSVPASQFGRAEQSPWAQSVEQRNTRDNSTNSGNDGIVHNQPLKNPGQSTYNSTARQMADNSTTQAEPVTPVTAPEAPESQYKPVWNNNGTNGNAVAPAPVKASPPAKAADNGKPEAVKLEPPKGQPVADAKKTEPPKAEAPKKENARPEQTAAAPAAGKSGPATINQIGLHFADKRMVLRVNADAPFEARWFVLTGPDRLVVDFPEPVKNLTIPTIPQNRLVKGARIGQQKDGFRLVLDLNAPVKVELKNDKAGNLEAFME